MRALRWLSWIRRFRRRRATSSSRLQPSGSVSAAETRSDGKSMALPLTVDELGAALAAIGGVRRRPFVGAAGPRGAGPPPPNPPPPARGGARGGGGGARDRG